MRQNHVKATLAAGGVAIGTSVIEFPVAGLPRIAAAAAADFVLLDTEHNGWTSDTLRPMLQSARSVDVVPLVRVESLDYRRIGTPLDLGALGIMVPTVETADDARRIVEFARYPPAGRRGAAFGVAHDDYVSGDRPSSIESANREVLLIALVETERGAHNAAEIAAVDGIDVVWIGQVDLSMSMGLVDEYDHPRYQAVFDSIVDAANANGKTLGYTATSLDEGRRLLARGFRCISFSNDLRLYQRALADGVRQLRQAATSVDREAIAMGGPTRAG